MYRAVRKSCQNLAQSFTEIIISLITAYNETFLILPSMRIAHNSSGTDLLILLNLLSCAKLKHWKTVGKRPLVVQVTDRRVGTRCMPPYGPEAALLLQVTKHLTLKIHLLLSVKSLQYLLNLCIAKIVLSTFKKIIEKEQSFAQMITARRPPS